MSKQIKFTQSLWAMERRNPDGLEPSLNKNLDRIAKANFDGISAPLGDMGQSDLMAKTVNEYGLCEHSEWQCFPKTVDDLKPVLEFAAKWGGHHICLQADIRPRKLDECIPIVEGWLELSKTSPIPVWIETHRDRLTTDLYFTLDLLERFPEMELVADLSHYMVGREFSWPISDENHGYIRQILDRSRALHGRVASREQVQIEISFPHHKPWVDQFLDWWGYFMKSYLQNSKHSKPLTFNCELGPRPYAITDRDGRDTTDRWSEALILRQLVLERWDKISAQNL